MSRRALAERVGLPLAQARPDHHQHLGLDMDPHKDLKVTHSVRLSGNLPNPDATVTFDFAGEGANMVVHLISEGLGARTCALWNVQAVEDRDAKGLVGFVQFAESLDMKGYQLAHLISGLKPV